MAEVDVERAEARLEVAERYPTARSHALRTLCTLVQCVELLFVFGWADREALSCSLASIAK